MGGLCLWADKQQQQQIQIREQAPEKRKQWFVYCDSLHLNTKAKGPFLQNTLDGQNSEEKDEVNGKNEDKQKKPTGNYISHRQENLEVE